MIILGIETSCDETAAAVLTKNGERITILSNIVASSANLQAKYGGIIPEQAAREQIKSIIPVIEEALIQAFYPTSHLNNPASHLPLLTSKIDTIAVTYGPGLIGSLLVGVETAKVLATVWKKPLIPVNHLIGHFYANWIAPQIASSMTPRNDDLEVPIFPCLGLLVSGGHTDLVLFTNHGKYKYLGGTRDDAAGECFDKCARLLGLPYPGGPQISKLAAQGKDIYKLPRPMIDSDNFDFSFSGLKTAVANLLQSHFVIPIRRKPERNLKINHEISHPFGVRDDKLNNLCASIEAAIVDALVAKTIAAARKYRVKQIMVAGGVAANQRLVGRFQAFGSEAQARRVTVNRLKIKLHIPPANLCTDNGAMIASAAFFAKPIKNPLKLQANPNLSLEY